MWSALGHSLQSILHDQITNFIKNAKKEWKAFNQCETAEYLTLPIVHTHDLEHSFNLQVAFFGTIPKLWIQDILPYHEFSVLYISGVSFLALFEPHFVHPFLVNNLTPYIISQSIGYPSERCTEKGTFYTTRVPYGLTS